VGRVGGSRRPDAAALPDAWHLAQKDPAVVRFD